MSWYETINDLLKGKKQKDKKNLQDFMKRIEEEEEKEPPPKPKPKKKRSKKK